MNALQKHLLLTQEIEAAQKNIARQSLGHTYTDQGLRLQGLIDENTIGQMVENKLQKMWEWFTSHHTWNFRLRPIRNIFYHKNNN